MQLREQATYAKCGKIVREADLRPSLVVLNPKMELGAAAAAVDAAGLRRIHVNPTGRFAKLCPHTNVNFLHHIYDAYHSPNPAHRKAVVPMTEKQTLTMFPDPTGGGDNSAAEFFATGSRKAGNVIILNEILCGRLPYPGLIWSILSDPQRFREYLERVESAVDFVDREDDRVARYTVSQAKSLLANLRTKGLARYFEEFRNGAEKHTNIYNVASHLADYGRDNSIPLSILRREPCVLFIDTPTEYLDVYGAFQSAFVNALIDMAKMTPGRTIWIIAEEAGNAGIAGLEDQLTIVRGLNLKVFFVFQYEGQWAKLFGPEAENALNSQMDVTILAGVQDKRTCEMYSARMGKRTESYVHASTAVEASTDLRAVELFTPAQIAGLPRSKALAFITNAQGQDVRQPTVLFDKLPYGSIIPHREIMGFNFIENAEPLKLEPLVEIEYSDDAEPVCLTATDPDQFENEEAYTADDVPFFTPYSFMWLYLLVAIWVATKIATGVSLVPFVG